MLLWLRDKLDIFLHSHVLAVSIKVFIIVALVSLIVLQCSGCATKTDVLTDVKVVTIDKCSQPQVPELPSLTIPSKDYNKVERLKFLKNLAYRDVILRNYITGLQDTISCYESQVNIVNATIKQDDTTAK